MVITALTTEREEKCELANDEVGQQAAAAAAAEKEGREAGSDSLADSESAVDDEGAWAGLHRTSLPRRW